MHASSHAATCCAHYWAFHAAVCMCFQAHHDQNWHNCWMLASTIECWHLLWPLPPPAHPCTKKRCHCCFWLLANAAHKCMMPLPHCFWLLTSTAHKHCSQIRDTSAALLLVAHKYCSQALLTNP
eukprot:1148158-Pelagomonas_calceolata.AAC.4